jgi:hypothetical protein
MRIVAGKVKLFDGFEDALFEKKFSVAIDNIQVHFDAYDITPNKFYALADKSPFVNGPDFYVNEKENIYKSAEGLPLYFLEQDRFVLIFSLGEYQPGRYQLFLEQAWIK